MSEIATVPGLTQQQMAAVIAEPMLACPEVLRPAVWQVWVCHQHLFPSALPLAGSIGRWTREGKLHPEDAQVILRRALLPEFMRGFRFAADLLTFLAEAAKELTDRRKRRAEMEDRRKGGGNNTQRAEVARLMAGIGSMPTE